MAEIWRDIEGYEGLYQVSNLGRVKSFQRGERILKLNFDRCGYLRLRLKRGNSRKSVRIHRLVATAFIPNPDGKREVNHIDGDKTNNRAENLEWVTHSENVQHAFDAGLISALRGEDSPQAKLTNEQARYIRDNPDGLNTYELARMFGVDQCTVSDVQRGRVYKNAGGAIRTTKLPDPKRIPDNVREQIRREYIPNVCGHSSHTLARKYGVSQKTILKIVNEK